MKVQKQKLKDVISNLKPGISKKATMEQSDAIIFDTDTVRTYNDEVSVLAPLKTGIKGAVSSKELISYLDKCTADEFELSVDNNILLLKGKRSKAGIKIDSDIKLSFDEISIEDSWQDLPKDFVEAINFTSFTTSNDMSKPVLCNIYIKDSYACSSDNKRATKYEMESEIENEFLIDKDSAKQLCNYSPIEYMVSDSWIHFRNENKVIFSCRNSCLKFPNIDSIMNVSGDSVSFPRNIESMLEEVKPFAVDDYGNDAVTVTLSKNNITVKTQSRKGFAEHSKKIRFDGDIEFAIKLSFLCELVKLDSKIQITDSLLKISGDNFEHVSLLMVKKD